MIDIEREVFLRTRPQFDKIIDYGFTYNDCAYTYECDILNGDFKAKITIDKDGIVTGKVYDNMTNDEYLPLRIEARDGAFVNTVRSEYKKVLIDIANKCYIRVLFSSDQANRIAELIFKKYAVRPDFPWDEKPYKTSGVFRHTDNKKWFALIMNVSFNKVDKSSKLDEMVDVINLKVDSEEMDSLIKNKCVFPAYHMSHKTWISIILNDSLEDAKVMKFIERSFCITKTNKKKWFFEGC